MGKNKPTSVRIQPEFKEDIQILAEYKGISVSKTINKALDYYIAHEYDLIRMIKLQKLDEGD